MKVLFLISALLLAPQRDESSITGKWLWQGAAGWQRIVLDLKADGPRVTGVIRMGPGATVPESPDDFWEFFFDPAEFKISNGRIEGNTIYFEHEVRKSIPSSVSTQSFFRPNLAPPVPSKFIYRGAIMGNTISLTRETVSRAADPWMVGSHRISFSVGRVK